jgi:hypothetical protein
MSFLLIQLLSSLRLFMFFICFFHSLCTIFSFCFPCYLSLLSSSLHFVFRLSFPFLFSSFFSCVSSFHSAYLPFHSIYFIFVFSSIFLLFSCLLVLFLFLFSCFTFSFSSLAFYSLAFPCFLFAFFSIALYVQYSFFSLSSSYEYVPFNYNFHLLFLFFLRD